MTSNLHLRGIDSTLMGQLKKQAMEQQISVNSFILQLLKQSLGLTTQRKLAVYHDLDQLAGTWTKQEAKSFLKNTAEFELIDKVLHRRFL